MTDRTVTRLIQDPRRAFVVSLLGLLALGAWAALAWWSAGPYARYVTHDGWGSAAFIGALCAAVPQGDIIVPALLHVAAWLLMITAMMVPTTLPLLSLFARVVADRSDAGRLVARVVGGYVLAWSGFGLFAHGADEALRHAATTTPWLALHAWAVGAAVLAGAGLFQFSDLKYRCLERCRTPFGFVTSRWHGREPGAEAFRLGLEHGLFCVGCCWALMLVMFVVGTANLAWMIVLAIAMAAEKNLPIGARLRTPFGIALIAAAALLVAENV